MRFSKHSLDFVNSSGGVETPENSILRNRFFRNISILFIIIAIVLILYHTALVTPLFTKLLLDSTQNDAVRIARHLASSMVISEKSEIGKESINIRLPKEIDKVKDDFELTNFKVFSASGEVVFSADQDEVGQINQRRYFQEIVAKGKVYAKVVSKDEESLEGHKVTSDVLETYVPLMDNGRFLGAFEIYYDITARKRQLHKLVSQSSTIIILFASGLLMALIFILYQENMAMKKRRHLEEERIKSERLKGVIEMAGAACHELNQPLQVISAYSQFLLSSLPEDNPQFKEIKKIKEMTDRLGQITKKIMYITRYETKEYVQGSTIIDIDKASSDIT